MAQIIDICSQVPEVWGRLSERQQTVLSQISTCRTEWRGVNTYQCSNPDCKHMEFRYSSCKNRNCSVCSWLPREKWKQQRANDMIPDTCYYHDVFTVPYEFSQLAAMNKKEVQTLMFRSVADTLKHFEKERCNGGKIGFIEFLHTWSTRLLEHCHIHVIIPGGYLKDDKWHDMSKYMFPQKALAKVFKGKFCSGLRSLYKKGLLKLEGRLSGLSDPRAWGEFVDRNYNRHWHVHVEPTRGGDPMRLVGYLSNYVYKTAIDHSRIESVAADEVVFSYRSHDEGDRGTMKKMSLSPEAFLGRFAGHIQPKGFMRIRYYGILGGGVKRRNLETIFAQKGKTEVKVNQDIHRSSCETILESGGLGDLMKCPVCGSRMQSMWELMRIRDGCGPPENEMNESHQSRCA